MDYSPTSAKAGIEPQDTYRKEKRKGMNKGGKTTERTLFVYLGLDIYRIYLRSCRCHDTRKIQDKTEDTLRNGKKQ